MILPLSLLFAADDSAARLTAHRLHASTVLKRYKMGAVTFVNPARDLPQIRQAAATGRFAGTTFSLSLLRTLDRLSARSSRRHPLSIMSLYRTNSRAHSRGIAVDIAGFGNSIIDSRKTGRGLPAILAIVKALGPGEYSLGLPKPPGSDPIPLLPPPRAPAEWPFFPAPIPRLVLNRGKLVVAPKVEGGKLVAGRRGKLQPEILRWPNERSAPARDLGSPELRVLLSAAEKRGVKFRSLFPDALDHLHLEAP